MVSGLTENSRKRYYLMFSLFKKRADLKTPFVRLVKYCGQGIGKSIWVCGILKMRGNAVLRIKGWRGYGKVC
jgi:hypothetical protein